MFHGSRGVGLWLGGVIGFCLVAVLSVGPVMGSEMDAPMTCSGSVVEMGTDESGAVSTVGIKTEHEGDLVVANDAKGEELKNLVDRKIEVTGTVQEVDGQKTISITDYKVIE